MPVTDHDEVQHLQAGSHSPAHRVTGGDSKSPIDTQHLPSFKEDGDEDDSLWDIPESKFGKV